MPTAYNAPLSYNAPIPYNGALPPEPPSTLNLYSVRVVDMAGTPYTNGILTRGTVESFTFELNQPGDATISFSVFDPEALLLQPDHLGVREVQIWRSGRCVWWGIPLQVAADDTTVRFTCAGLLWYLLRRFFGPVINNYLDPNSDFEAGSTGWAVARTNAASVSDWRAKGSKSMRLTLATEGQDGYLYRRHTTTTGTSPVLFIAKALAHITDAGWVGPALEERGLYVERQATPGGAAIADSPDWDRITNSTERGSADPLRFEVGTFVPANTTQTIEVRLYSPGGVIYWDATGLFTEESVGSDVFPEPASLILERVIAYAQDPTWGKSDLNFDFAVGAGVTASLVKVFQFHNDGNIFDGIGEFAKMGLCDFGMEWAPAATARKFCVYPGRRGTTKTAAALRLGGAGANVSVGFSYGADATGLSTAPRVIGTGSGADKEVGRAVDTSQTNGLVLESVESAPVEATVDSLQLRATERLNESRQVKRDSSFSVPAALFFDNDVQPGDSVPVVANYGYIQINEVRRVRKITVNGVTDVATPEWV